MHLQESGFTGETGETGESGATLFAALEDGGETDASSGCRLGRHYRLEVAGVSGADRMLSFLGASLGARMDASRPVCLRHPLPPKLSAAQIAVTAASRFADSQARAATLCFLGVEAYLAAAGAAFPCVLSERIREDLVRALAAYFEPYGGLFRTDSGDLVALFCASRPVDTDLVSGQLSKYLTRFLTAALDADVTILRFRAFDSPGPTYMERFLCGAETAPGP